MARSNARGYLFTEEVRLKKYFYVLRPLLAILHIEHGLGIPPVRFDPLVNAVAPGSIRPSIAELLERKRKTSELGTGKPIEETCTTHSANARAPKRLDDLLSSGEELPEEPTRGVLALPHA